jgi:hypothetical protein
VKLWLAQSTTHAGPTRPVDGTVVDIQGRPVANARVVSASVLGADSVGIGLPLGDLDDSLRITTTDSAGRFRIADATPVGVVAGELADRRSKPAVIADHVRLVLEPTRRVSGRIDLAGIPPTRAAVYCVRADAPAERFTLISPIAPDGGFSLDGASVGAVRIGVFVQIGWASESFELETLPASPGPATGRKLAVAISDRELDVLVRSAVDMPLDGVQVALLSGKRATDRLKSVHDLAVLQGGAMQTHFAVPAVSASVPSTATDKLRGGDLVAHFEHVRPGALTVCAFTIGGDLADSGPWARLRNHAEQLALKCEPVGPDANLVVVAVPPQQRLD